MGESRILPTEAASGIPVGDDLIVIMSEEAAVRPRRRRVRKEPTTTLEIAVPAALAESLKQAIAVIPGMDLDQLAVLALQRLIVQAGLDPVRRASSCRRHTDDLLVII